MSRFNKIFKFTNLLKQMSEVRPDGREVTDRPNAEQNRYNRPSYCRAEMYAGRVACCPLVNHRENADGTDRLRTPDHYITLSAMDAVSVITKNHEHDMSETRSRPNET